MSSVRSSLSDAARSLMDFYRIRFFSQANAIRGLYGMRIKQDIFHCLQCLYFLIALSLSGNSL
jgi:hypothetical protein